MFVQLTLVVLLLVHVPTSRSQSDPIRLYCCVGQFLEVL